MYHGRLVATLDPSEVTPRSLGSYMTGAALASDNQASDNQASDSREGTTA